MKTAALLLALVAGFAHADYTDCYACDKYANEFSQGVKDCRAMQIMFEKNECLSKQLDIAVAAMPQSKKSNYQKSAKLCKKQAAKNERDLMSGSMVGIELQLCEIYAATH
ncbi:hypothetical protein HQ393_04645 [Chitinibacter bivalviorum]|uniref:DUF1311 domain-containing protein n=1 Tax=Chitinibacter bivalviorum TaxID=2739434 RepID=A0A7H9BFW5_9NEIS|nr:hypothetical protein [Chitinibacter bivalviorum]QLG87600.1 hypothetical protein HQ393_04645 [Chitinibacter bivalviorum]